MTTNKPSDIRLQWHDFYALVASQRRRNPETHREIHVFDHPDDSYLQEIERCRAIFQRYHSFSAMPIPQRRVVAGFGDSRRRYLGSMQAAGQFKHLVLESPRTIGDELDKIPLAGPVSIRQVRRYLVSTLDIRGVGWACSTRLLAVKRPDCFLPVTSRSRVRETLGHPVSLDGYVDLHRCIWSLPWYQAAEPSDVQERRVWQARVALLDVLLYEVLP